MARRSCALLGKPESLIQHVDRPPRPRPPLLPELRQDQGAGLAPRHTFEQALEKTVRWYVDNEWWWRKIKTGEFKEYYRKWYGNRKVIASV